MPWTQAFRSMPSTTGSRSPRVVQWPICVGHLVLWARQSAGPQTERLTKFAPVLLIQLYFVFLRSGFDAFPGGVAFSLGHPLHLLETGDCVAHARFQSA
jgi:hypothetical protein